MHHPTSICFPFLSNSCPPPSLLRACSVSTHRLRPTIQTHATQSLAIVMMMQPSLCNTRNFYCGRTPCTRKTPPASLARLNLWCVPRAFPLCFSRKHALVTLCRAASENFPSFLVLSTRTWPPLRVLCHASTPCCVVPTPVEQRHPTTAKTTFHISPPLHEHSRAALVAM